MIFAEFPLNLFL